MTRRKIIRSLLLALAALSLLLPASALADEADKIITDCTNNGRLVGTYDPKDLREALDRLGPDQDEYTTCREDIRAALNGGKGSNRRGVGPGGIGPAGIGTEPTPEDLAALSEAQRAGREGEAPELTIDGKKVSPGPAGGLFNPAASANHLPGPLVFVLIALAVLTGAAAAPLARRLAGGPGAALRRLRR